MKHIIFISSLMLVCSALLAQDAQEVPAVQTVIAACCCTSCSCADECACVAGQITCCCAPLVHENQGQTQSCGSCSC